MSASMPLPRQKAIAKAKTWRLNLSLFSGCTRDQRVVKGRERQNEVEIIALGSRFIANATAMHLNDMTDKRQPVAGSGDFQTFVAADPFQKQLITLFCRHIRAGSKNIKFYPLLAWSRRIFYYLTAISHRLPRTPRMINNLLGVLGGVGKKIGINLSQ